ncbi:MAG: molybdate transport system substrate-binding protein [Actinomycetota bacterium]|nr:molybdate transport system substrate-binding protein [Actinomycetota bacterium]
MHMATRASPCFAAIVMIAITPGCSSSHQSTSSSGGRTLTVLAASSLTEAFGALGRTFESTHSGTRVTFSFAGSDTLAAQILQGAPGDLFASASPKQMDTVVRLNKVAKSPQVFATNRLVLVTPGDNPARISSIEDLARPGIKIVLAAPGVPAGDYARQVFVKLGIYRAVTANVVSNELDDQSVLSKVRLGEADAGIVYVSDLSGGVEGEVHAVAIPNRSNVVATYEIAPLVDAPDETDALSFERLVLSSQGQATLHRYGFGDH